jgi:diguanylate cyclase (GGDEF)-like protein/PAS domain S-box-containing protein
MDEQMDMNLFYKSLMDNLYDGVYFVDRDRCITYWNNGAERITGYKAESMLGTFCNSNNKLDHVTDDGLHICDNGCPLLACIRDGKTHEAEVHLLHADGYRLPVLVRASPIRNENGQIIGAVEVFSNNQSMFKIKRKVDELEHNILLDPLTNIGNRAFIEMKVKSAVGEYGQHGIKFGLLFMDIDHFKSFNDTYGHNVGDLVLKTVAGSLSHGLRGSDACGRWGGEEFVAIVYEVDEQGLLKVTEKLRNMIESSHIRAGERSLNVTISAGMTLVRQDDTPESIIQRADELMYQSKLGGRNRVTVG